VLHAARWKCRTQISPKIGHLGTIAQLCRAISSQLRHVLTIGSSNISSRCPHNMVNFGPLAAEISPVVWGTPANFNGFASRQRYTARHSGSGRQPNFASLNRGRHLYSAGRPSRWALAHILVKLTFVRMLILIYNVHWFTRVKRLNCFRHCRKLRRIGAASDDDITWQNSVHKS